MKKSESIDHLLKKHRLKKTALRMALLEEFLNAREPLRQAEIIERLEKRGGTVDRVTVYRNLVHLKTLGLLHELKNNSYVFCSHECEKHPHVLLVCQSCHEHEEINDHRRISQLMGVLAGFRFFGSGGSLVLNGTCAQCSA